MLDGKIATGHNVIYCVTPPTALFRTQGYVARAHRALRSTDYSLFDFRVRGGSGARDTERERSAGRGVEGTK